MWAQDDGNAEDSANPAGPLVSRTVGSLVSPMGSGRTSSGRQERTEMDSIPQTTASDSAPGTDLHEQAYALRQREINTAQSEPQSDM
jgi:hypothetical protein